MQAGSRSERDVLGRKAKLSVLIAESIAHDKMSRGAVCRNQRKPDVGNCTRVNSAATASSKKNCFCAFELVTEPEMSIMAPTSTMMGVAVATETQIHVDTVGCRSEKANKAPSRSGNGQEQ